MPSKSKASPAKPEVPAVPQAAPATGSLARTAAEIAKLDFQGLSASGEALQRLKDVGLMATDPAKLRAFADLQAAAKAIAERPAPIVHTTFRPFPSAEVRAIQAVEARTKGVNQAITNLAELVSVQAGIAERQEAGIVNVVAELERSRVASDTASGRLANLTVVLIVLTALIAILTAVLILRGT